MASLGVFVTLGYLTLRGLSLEELMLPAAALGLPMYLIVLVDPMLGLALLIACIGLSPEFTIGGIRNLRMEDFFIPGLLLGWLLRSGMQRTPLAPARIWAPAVCSGICMVLSTVAGSWAGSTPPATAFLILGKYAEYLLIYLLVLNSVKTEAEIRALAIFSVVVALVSSTLSLGSTATFASDMVEGRVRGPFGETSNIYGGYLTLHLMIAIGLFLHTTGGGGRVAGGAAIVLLGTSILFTYSRTTYVAVGGAILVYGAFKYRRLLLILAILAGILPILAPSSVMDRMATVGGVASGVTPPSWTSRLEAWQWAMNRMSPVDHFLGRGIGSVKFGDVDSEYVRIFSDLGVVGIALFVWLLLRIGRMALQTHDRLQEFTFRRGYLAGYLMAFVAMVVHSVAATTFSAIRTEETFMVLTGLMTAVANLEGSVEAARPGEPVILLRDVPVLEPLRR